MADNWFYADGGQQCGPVSFEALQERARRGKLRPADLVWKAGMASWAPASSQPGLFGEPVSTPRPRPEPERLRNDDEDYDEIDRGPRPRRRRSSSSSGAGLKILLFGSAGLLVLGVVCCGVVGVIYFGTNKSNVRSWSLNAGDHTYWSIPFQQGDKVRLTVTSDRNSDVDLFVFSDRVKMDSFVKSVNFEMVAQGLCLAFDNGDSKDCLVEFTAPATQDYYVLVANRMSRDQPNRNQSNSGKLVFFPPPR